MRIYDRGCAVVFLGGVPQASFGVNRSVLLLGVGPLIMDFFSNCVVKGYPHDALRVPFC